jgi:hypothetical protein
LGWLNKAAVPVASKKPDELVPLPPARVSIFQAEVKNNLRIILLVASLVAVL